MKLLETLHKCAGGSSDQKVVAKIFAKRSVVSAANYAERSSFAKDQILFLSFYRSEFACKRGFFAYNQNFRIQPILSAVVSRFCSFDTWI